MPNDSSHDEKAAAFLPSFASLSSGTSEEAGRIITEKRNIVVTQSPDQLSSATAPASNSSFSHLAVPSHSAQHYHQYHPQHAMLNRAHGTNSVSNDLLPSLSTPYSYSIRSSANDSQNPSSERKQDDNK